MLTLILWTVIALGAAFGLTYLAVRRNVRRLPPIVLPAGETMPVTALERLAKRSLILVLLPTLAAAAVVAYHGPDVWWANDHVRLLATGLLVAALAAFTFYVARIGAWTSRDDGTLDERDRAILASAPAGQAPAMLVTLAAWMIGLIEAYHGVESVPTVFLYLIFWSCVMVSVLALLAGVVVGSRRQ
jgi:hypothetical protein